MMTKPQIKPSLKSRIRWKLYDTWVWISSVVFLGCERCGSLRGVEYESSRTAYHVDNIEGRENTPADPNRQRRYCRDCAAEHHQHWDSMWDDYYSGLL